MRQVHILVLAMVLVFMSACAQQVNIEANNAVTEPTKGRAVFAITDAAADMGAVTAVEVTVDKIQVHSNEKGWIIASSNPRTYDLLELKAQNEQRLLADVQLEEGTYNQIRLDISKVVVSDANGQQEAKLPSGQLKLNANLVVEANTTSAATFDFVADESLHVTGNGKYIMAPVIQLETVSDASVDVESDNQVEIKGGKVNTNVKLGMDANGNVGIGIGIAPNVEVVIDNAGAISIGKASAKAKGNAIFTITDAAADMGSITSVKIIIDNLMVHSDSKGWVNVTTTPQTFDLLELRSKGTQELIASATLEPGAYNQLRLDISKVMVTDADGEQEAKLPSNELKIFGSLVITPNSTSAATFDFIANESLHMTGNNRYVMAPVVKLDTKENADVEIKSDKTVEIKGGLQKTSIRVGMDENGNVGVGRRIASNADLSIENDKVKAKAKVSIGY